MLFNYVGGAIAALAVSLHVIVFAVHGSGACLRNTYIPGTCMYGNSHVTHPASAAPGLGMHFHYTRNSMCVTVQIWGVLTTFRLAS